MSLYNLLQFVHVVGSIVWIGGVTTLFLLNSRMVVAEDPAVRAALARQSSRYGQSVIGPAAITTLAAGVLMVLVSSLSFSMLWISWGFLGVFVSMLIAMVPMRRATEAIQGVSAKGTPDPGEISALQQRLTTINIINLIVLLSTVWAMVAKPTL